MKDILRSLPFVQRFAQAMVEALNVVDETVEPDKALRREDLSDVVRKLMEEKKFPAVFNEVVLGAIWDKLLDFLGSLRNSRDTLSQLAVRPDVSGALGQQILGFLDSIAGDLEAYFNIMYGDGGAYARIIASFLASSGSKNSGLAMPHKLKRIAIEEALNGPRVRDVEKASNQHGLNDQKPRTLLANAPESNTGQIEDVIRTGLGQNWLRNQKIALANEWDATPPLSDAEYNRRNALLSPKTLQGLTLLLKGADALPARQDVYDFLGLEKSQAPAVAADDETHLIEGEVGDVAEQARARIAGGGNE